MNFSDIGRWLTDTLWPARCVGCSAMGLDLCEQCANGMVHAVPGHAQSSNLNRCASAFKMNGVTETAIYHLKYRGIQGLAAPLARAAAYAIGLSSTSSSMFGHNPTFIPVPLHASRLRERGYNQAALIAQELALIAVMPYDESLLIRNRRTNSQVETHARHERFENMAGAFSVANGRTTQGRDFVLVDDVRTTGATLENCAHALREAGAHSVSALTIAQG